MGETVSLLFVRCPYYIRDIIRVWQEKNAKILRKNSRSARKNRLPKTGSKPQPFVRPASGRAKGSAATPFVPTPSDPPATQRRSRGHLRGPVCTERPKGAQEDGVDDPLDRSEAAGISAAPLGGRASGGYTGLPIVTRMGGDRWRPQRSAGRRLAPVSWSGDRGSAPGSRPYELERRSSPRKIALPHSDDRKNFMAITKREKSCLTLN
jgi:hypothetical protein